MSQSDNNLRQSLEDSLLEKVKRNMEKVTALQFRQNTGNGGYGFDHILKKVPQQEAGADPYEYNYKVHSNTKI
jgi:hypothetical protein